MSEKNFFENYAEEIQDHFVNHVILEPYFGVDIYEKIFNRKLEKHIVASNFRKVAIYIKEWASFKGLRTDEINKIETSIDPKLHSIIKEKIKFGVSVEDNTIAVGYFKESENCWKYFY